MVTIFGILFEFVKNDTPEKKKNQFYSNKVSNFGIPTFDLNL
jgi:hypothetical protein